MTRTGLALILLAGLLLAQIAMGCDPLVVALCGVAVVAGLSPALILGLDLYTILSALFCIRYVGLALVAKTLLLQPLDGHLHAPVAAYALSALFVVTQAAVIVGVRMLDRGRSLLEPFALAPAVQHDLKSLRVIGATGFLAGVAAYLGAGFLLSRDAEAVNAGAYVLLIMLGGVHLIGLVGEAAHSAQARGRLVSGRLVLMFGAMFLISTFLNARAVLFDGVVAVLVTGIVYRVVRWRHVAAMGGLAVAASVVITPVTMELRDLKYGKTAVEFAHASVDVLKSTLLEPGYLDRIRTRQAQEAADDNPLVLYDYYGNSGSVLNRFSYVGLVDAVYHRAERQTSIGWASLAEVYSRVVPGFLVSKEPKPYGYGDWLAWELGMFNPPMKTFTNFGLPMEGLAVMGLVGFALYPALVFIPILFLCSRISSFRVPYPASIFLFSALQWQFVEGNLDTFIIMATRQIPILVVSLLGIQFAGRLLLQAGKAPAGAYSQLRAIRAAASTEPETAARESHGRHGA